jgi:transglutaminase-like putative cysteine protease
MGLSKLMIWILVGILVISGSFGGYYLYGYLNKDTLPQCRATTLQVKAQVSDSDRIDTLGLPSDPQWLKDYEALMEQNGIAPEYLVESDSYDIYAPEIQAIATKALEEANFDSALDYVISNTYSKVCYTMDGNDCQDTSASKVISRGYGLCSTMSMVNIAVLRSMGLAARPVSGCYKDVASCGAPLSLIPKPTRVAPAYFSDDGRVYIGRVETGMQGPHAWVEVWHPVKGWIIIESTNGDVVAGNCPNYRPVYINTVNIQDFCSLPKDDYYRCLAS